MSKFLPVIALCAIFLFAGCAQKNVVAPTPSEETPTPAPEASVKEPEQKIVPPEEPVKEQDLSKAEPVETAPPQPAPVVEIEKLDDIYFDFDKYEIRADSKAAIKAAAQLLSNDGVARLVIEGNADERGTNEYNLALGDKRATSVKKYLTAMGVSAGRIDTVSYGEEKPVCTENMENCWAKNRRAHFVVQRPK